MTMTFRADMYFREEEIDYARLVADRHEEATGERAVITRGTVGEVAAIRLQFGPEPEPENVVSRMTGRKGGRDAVD